MKSNYRLLFVFFISIMALVACGGNKVDETTAEQYKSKAKEVILLLNEQKYEEIYHLFDKTMKEQLPVEIMKKQITSVIEESGSFENFNKSKIDEKDGYYVAVIVASYSEKNRVYTISFNQQGEISGLFVK